MQCSALKCNLIGWLLFLLSACDGGETSHIALVQSQSVIADRDLLVEVARAFYARYSDQYDMLVLWGASGFIPRASYYLAVQNDVKGIGYQHDGPEFFDDSQEFGSRSLQGVIWIGPIWQDKAVRGGPDSVLGTLAHETAHRWGSTVRFRDDLTGDVSEELLGDGFHWSFFLDTGASPLGGNQWDDIGKSFFRAVPVDTVTFSQLDLYLMGLLSTEEVAPLRLLTHVRDEKDVPGTRFSKVSRRVIEPVTLKADLREISMKQIIEVEGRRDPEAGFNTREIRQAWIYVSKQLGQISMSDLATLQELQASWSKFFAQATGGRSSVVTRLFQKEELKNYGW